VDLTRALAMARHFAELRFIRGLLLEGGVRLVDGALYAAYPKEMGEVSTISTRPGCRHDGGGASRAPRYSRRRASGRRVLDRLAAGGGSARG
jgi:hypothetical protein